MNGDNNNFLFVNSSYGTVHKALNQKTGEIVAIKIVPIEDMSEDVEKEIRVMKTGSKSDFLVNFISSYIVDDCQLWVGFIVFCRLIYSLFYFVDCHGILWRWVSF